MTFGTKNLIKLYLGAAVILATSMGSILAGNILASKTKNIEFGAGQYFLKSCNTWININIISGETGSYGAPAGLSPLTGVEVTGINTAKCLGTHLTVKAQAKDGQFLPLLRTEPVSYICPDNFCADPSKVEDSFGLAIGTNGQITLDNQDQYRHLDIQRSNGTIKILFTYPAILASEAQNFLFQSTDL